MSGEVSDELKSKCIDKAFEMIKSYPLKDTYCEEFARYDLEIDNWYILDLNKEIHKIIEKQNKR